MHYTYISQVYHSERHLNIYLNLLQEIMFQYGTGFKGIDQRRYLFQKRVRVSEFIVDETLFKVGNEFVFLWIAIEPSDKMILGIRISVERSILVAEHFIRSLVKRYGKRPVCTDGGTWYLQACKFLKIKHPLHSPYEKSIIERTIQYIKDRTENFDDYFPCRKEGCKLEHFRNWLNLFTNMHNKMIINSGS